VHVLDKNHYGVIEPTMMHQIRALSEDVESVVELWSSGGPQAWDPVDEKGEGFDD
jgi:tellurite resistance-related uncharacterized protein